MYGRSVADARTQVRAGVGVVVRDERGWILLEKRSDCGLWGLPGGRIEPGESIEQTAVREAEEETGLRIEVTRLLGVYSGPEGRVVTFPDNVVQLVDTVVEARVVGGTLARSEESEELRFYAPAELPEDLAPPAREPLRDYVEGRAGVVR